MSEIKPALLPPEEIAAVEAMAFGSESEYGSNALVQSALERIKLPGFTWDDVDLLGECMEAAHGEGGSDQYVSRIASIADRIDRTASAEGRMTNTPDPQITKLEQEARQATCPHVGAIDITEHGQPRTYLCPQCGKQFQP